MEEMRRSDMLLFKLGTLDSCSWQDFYLNILQLINDIELHGKESFIVEK